MPFRERAARLTAMLRRCAPPPSSRSSPSAAGAGGVQAVWGVEVPRAADAIEAVMDRAVAEGYEGIMIRDPGAPYAQGARSKALLKYKRFRDAEFEIVGFYEASGKDAGTVVFKCRTGSGGGEEGGQGGREFAVRPQGTRAHRAAMLRDAPALVGRLLTVRFQELTDDSVPRFPVGVAVRDYE